MRFIRKFPSDLRISIIYVVTGALWILYSDKALHKFVTDENLIKKIEVYKGWFFVAVTGVFLYMLIRTELRHRNKIYQELQKSKTKAEESDKLKSAFLGNMSHYLRTPMNSILGFVDLLQNRNLDESKKEKFLTVVNEQSNHLLQFINNILEISKLQNGQTEVNTKQFSINELFRKLQIRYQTEIEYLHKPVKLKGVYQTQDTLFYNDYEKLEYILTNLLSNAVKFTKEGEIHFGYTIKNGEAEIYVSDTGIGISPDKQELILNTFMLADPNLNNENTGMGLGLAITKGMVKVLNGKLWLEKSDSKGTEFRFTIPVKYDYLSQPVTDTSEKILP